MNSPSFEPGAIWITGITASGKTTLGKSLYERLIEEGFLQLEFLDGDEMRKSLDKKYGHSLKDRQIILENYVKIVLDKNQKGITVIVSTVSHRKAHREYARSHISQFMEVHLNCSPKVCMDRDYKGLYKKGYLGKYDLFPGVTEPYETSVDPELTLNTGLTPYSECADILYREVVVFLGLDS